MPRSPDDLKALESCIQAMRGYIAGNIDSRAWKRDASNSLQTSTIGTQWHDRMCMATSWLRKGKVDSAFRIFRKCTHNYEKILVAFEPRLFIITCHAILRLAGKWPDLGRSILQQMYALATITFQTPDYPVVTFLRSILKLGSAKFREFGLAYARNCVAVFQEHLLQTSQFLVDITIETTTDLVSFGVMDGASAISALSELVTALQPLKERCLDVLSIKTRIAWNYYRMGNCVQGLSLTTNIISESHSYPPSPDQAEVVRGCHVLSFCTNRRLRYLLDATVAGEELVKYCIATYGIGHKNTVDVLSDYMDFLKEDGDLSVLNSISQTLHKAVDQIYNDEDI
ncbi:hypothetical protein BKA67DRAFT_139462 [Truncatella angustata]|uniref:Uncharacterized protein n=1 Tax=Truncatella angustata TaxID=152316 RepID=A0A9P8UBJ1_9PEZI|nr:uncharacterized protein BKA67DRAFT_139462 [Truncatella angustata]KAH6640027.1 hypothetical protein BKA67DRAFT_139462 [Truncatella angustata]